MEESILWDLKYNLFLIVWFLTFHKSHINQRNNVGGRCFLGSISSPPSSLAIFQKGFLRYSLKNGLIMIPWKPLTKYPPTATEIHPFQNLNNDMLIWTKEIDVKLRRKRFVCPHFCLAKSTRKRIFSCICVRKKRTLKEHFPSRYFLHFHALLKLGWTRNSSWAS